MYYSDEFLNVLKNNIALSSVIEKKVKIIAKGNNKLASCPFHNEKTPSFHINDIKGFYHCFGCGAHGDIITFIMNTEHLNFKESIEKLANEYNITLPKNEGKIVDITKINNIYEINEIVTNFFEKNLLSIGGKNCLKYFNTRGLDENHINKFRLGFAPNSFDNLINYLKAKNISEEQMLEAGVIAINERKNFYDKFRNRAIIPIFDKRGRIIAFTGRTLNKDIMPKYMNSPETRIYHKGSVLFNYFFAKEAIFKKKKAILVEGNFDAISLFIFGIENVVAPMGTAATIEQINELWKVTDEIIICFDGDNAGKKATERITDLVLPYINAYKNIKIANLPNNIDPDDFVHKFGKDAFIKFIDDKTNCLDLSEFLFKKELKYLNFDNSYLTPENKSKLEIKCLNIIKNIKDQIVAKNFDYYFKGEIFKVSRFNIQKKNTNYKNLTKININNNINFDFNSIEGLKSNILNIEENIFLLLINNLDLVKKLYKNYNIDLFTLEFISANSSDLLKLFFQIIEEEKTNDKQYLFLLLENNNFTNYLSILKQKIFLNNLNDKDIFYLYSLILDKNIILLNIEAKKLAIKNNDEEKRKIINNELENLHQKKLDLEENF